MAAATDAHQKSGALICGERERSAPNVLLFYEPVDQDPASMSSGSVPRLVFLNSLHVDISGLIGCIC